MARINKKLKINRIFYYISRYAGKGVRENIVILKVINVNNEINPCHRPIQNPAVTTSYLGFPGAQDEITISKSTISQRFLFFKSFIIK